MAGSLRIVLSNRLEALEQRLAEVLARPLSSPLVPEVILVPSPGVARWTAMALARRFGAWMNGRFPLPNAYLDRLFRLAAEPGTAGAWEPRVLRWRVMECLGEALERPGFEPVRRYLLASERQLKRFQLAERVAEIFDGYAMFRPDEVLGWEAGQGAAEVGWQAEVWRELARREGSHRAATRRAFLGRLADPAWEPGGEGLPERLSAFGVSALPPFHLEALSALAERVEVNLFLLSPCREYWADIVPEATASRKEREAGGSDLHYEPGNRLLASLGRSGRDFFARVQDLEADPVEDYRDPGRETLLQSLQADILELREGGAGGEKRPLAASDRSVRFHGCHSPMREAEVLRDALLDLLEHDGTLAPSDVVVMTPDVEAYAPFLEAVFGGAQEPRLPYAVADRAARAGSPVVDAFLRVLGLVGGRFGAAAVLDLLECGAVRRRMGLSASDVELAHGWVRGTRIHWGADAADRERLGLPGFPENTWQAGLDRLLLGYAMAGEGEGVLLRDTLPFDAVEGGEEAQALGRLAEFARRLFEGCRALEERRPLAAWAESFASLFEALFEPEGEDEAGGRLVRNALARLAEAGALAGFAEPVDLEVARTAVGEDLTDVPRAGGVLTGGVTVCGMRSLRGVPFRVVCLIGMNDGAFPRPSRALGFDLLARDPRPGDRSPRLEDRYAFLEALLAARDHLHVSYVGQSLRDGSEIPPSVLVSELLDAVDRSHAPADGSSARDRLVTRHRLQAFSPAYFLGEGARFSYSEDDARASRNLSSRAVRRRRGLFVRRLPPPPPDLLRVDLAELTRFFSNPSGHLLARRLGLHLDDGASIVEEREPFEVGGLERYGLQGELVARGLRGEDPSDALALARARGLLPHGSAGAGAFAEVRVAAEEFLEVLRPHVAGEVLDARVFQKGFPEGLVLEGRLDGVRPGGLVLYRPAALKGRDRVRAWIHHLVLNLVAGEDGPHRTVVVASDQVAALGPVGDAEARLGELLCLHAEGLCRALPFFPESSWTYAERRWGRGDPARDALRRARERWEEGYERAGEGADPSFALCFGEEDPFGEEFERLAEALFRPWIELSVPAGGEGA
jgi:exodeoxyribonuclease V gamma subunit